MKDALIVSTLSLVPKKPTARLMGLFARTRLPALLRRGLLRWYVKKYKVNLDECVGTLDDYPTLVDFFTRALKPGLRPIDPAPDALVSPVDGRAYSVGFVHEGRIPQAEGRSFSAAELLGEGDRYEGGAYAVLYLSPQDYHRVHVPREGLLRRWRYSPGQLWPVFDAATRRVPELFSRNERLTSFLDVGVGELAVVMVGAFGVGRMRVVYDDITTNDGGEASEGRLEPARELGRGDELGRFEMGSTVILVCPPGTGRFSVAPGDRVRVGQRIGALILG